MHAPLKYVEKGLAVAANGAWVVFNNLNKISQAPAFTPSWSDKPLLKSYQKTKPPLGWPRETDSLCPTCVREARQEILDGKKDVSILLTEKVGEIKATILERDTLRDDASRRDVLSFADLTLRSQRLLEDLESRGRAA